MKGVASGDNNVLVHTVCPANYGSRCWPASQSPKHCKRWCVCQCLRARRGCAPNRVCCKRQASPDKRIGVSIVHTLWLHAHGEEANSVERQRVWLVTIAQLSGVPSVLVFLAVAVSLPPPRLLRCSVLVASPFRCEREGCVGDGQAGSMFSRCGKVVAKVVSNFEFG